MNQPPTIAGVVIGTLMAIPIYDNLIGYLAWLGILIPAIGGVIIGDFFARWRTGMPEPLEHDFPVVRWENIAVYAVATLAAWVTSRYGWFIPPVTGIVLAVLGSYAVGAAARSRVGVDAG